MLLVAQVPVNKLLEFHTIFFGKLGDGLLVTLDEGLLAEHLLGKKVS